MDEDFKCYSQWESWWGLDPALSTVDGGAGGGQSLGERGGSLVWGGRSRSVNLPEWEGVSE